MAVELLAPAGSYEAGIAAIQNGANAIYLGGKAFGARASAKNFSNDEMVDFVSYAHIRNVSVYVTINTLIYDDEWNELESYIEFLYSIQVDALIVQDFGVIQYIHDHYSDFEIHCSTQMSLSNVQSINWLKQFGVTRVVLARELSIDQIQNIISQTDVEIEVFVHGAICMSYSGQCLMSSLIGQRSGNRGSCAQPCRLPYQLMSDGKAVDEVPSYLLSPKDLNATEFVDELITIGIHSFKIEGRMKSPEFVGNIVKSYRQLIDGKRIDVKKMNYQIAQMFNRSFTGGYLKKESGKHFLSDQEPRNQGIYIGEVVGFNKRQKRLIIKSNVKVHQFDVIRFKYSDDLITINKLYFNDLLVNHIDEGDLFEIDTKIYPKQGIEVFRMKDNELIKTIQETYKHEAKLVSIDIKFSMRINKQAELVVNLGDTSITVLSDHYAQLALKQSVNETDIANKLSKLNDTPFFIRELTIDIENNLFIPIRDINQMRQHAISEIIKFKQNKYPKRKHHIINKHSIKQETITEECKSRLMVFISTEDQIKAAIHQNVTEIYLYYNASFKDLFDQYKDSIRIVPVLDRIIHDNQINVLKKDLFLKQFDILVISDYGVYDLFKDSHQLILNDSFNIINHYSLISHIQLKNVIAVTMSNELSNNELQKFSYKNRQVVKVYGYIEAMVSEHCSVSAFHFGKKIMHCLKCKQNTYALKDRKGANYPLLFDEACRMHILHSKPLHLIQYIDKMKEKYLKLDFTIETYEETTQIINAYQKKNRHFKINSTTGYFLKDNLCESL